MKKRLISILLALCMLLCLVPTSVFAEDEAATGTAAIQFGTDAISVLSKNANSANAPTVYFGQDHENNPGAWRVIDYDGNSAAGTAGNMTLLAANNMGLSKFGASNAYADSELKEAIDALADKLTAKETDAVEKRTLASGNYDGENTDGVAGPAVSNAVFWPLSSKEANAVNNDLRVVDPEHPGWVSSYWWLRSPGENVYYTAVVSGGGAVFTDGNNVIRALGVRPAFNLDLNSVLFTSPAVGGKPDGGLTTVPEYTGNEWKLTLYDSKRNDFSRTTWEVSASTKGGTVEISYTDAKTGANEYISALIFDDVGNVIYYGRSNASLTEKDGTAQLTIPAGFAEGTYTLKVFNEQYNGDRKTDLASGFADVTLTVEKRVDEQFTLAPGGRYYFDLSGASIPGKANSGNSDGAASLPDTSLHYVPFTYAGTIEAYKLTSAMATTEEYAQQNKYAHSLFVADYTVTHTVSWDELNSVGLIFGKNYASGGVDYTLRAPSVGSNFTGLGNSERGTPKSNEWDTMLNKNGGYIQNWNKMYLWGQDTVSGDASYRSYRARRGYISARYWYSNSATGSNPSLGFRPVLEVLNADTLGSGGLKAVTLDLGGGTLGNSSKDIQIIVKNGSTFTAPASDGMTRPDGNTGSYFMWLDGNGNSYAPGGSVPADVTKLTVQWTAPTYAVTLHPNGGTIADGKDVTGYTYGVGATLPTDVTRTGYTFKGWYDNEGLTGDPVTAIGDTETGNKEYWAKWEINQYTVTVKPENGEADITITQDYGTPITAPTLTREGYQFNGWDKAFPTTMPAEDLTITAQWRDIAAPTGEIKIAENDWKSFLNTITFGLFFKDTQEVTINAADNSGTVFVSYLVTDRDLSEAELQSLVFNGYDEPFRIEPNGEYIVYAMLVDASMNITYLRSDRLTIDNVQPVITGIENGKTYCEAQTVTVDEKYVDTVTVNGTAVTLDENGSFVLSPADGEQKIVVTDKAGNTAEMTVTVNDGHTFGEWTSNGDGTHTRKCTVDGCNGVETKDCSGGTATCTEKAVCEVCGKAYGELDANNHSGLKHIDAKAATKDAEGNIEYWYCNGCGKYYSDKDGTKEIKKADTVTTKLKDDSKSPQTGDSKSPQTGDSKSPQTGDSKSPQTGDSSNFVLWLALLFISGGAAIGTTVVSRKKKYNR